MTTEPYPTLLDSKVPEGPIQDKWTKRKFDVKLVNPANKRTRQCNSGNRMQKRETYGQNNSAERHK